jgi:integrase
LAPAGFAVRCTSAGAKSFVLFHRRGGRQYLETLGRWHENAHGGSMTVAAAIARAKERAAELDKAGVDPRPLRTRRLEDGAAANGVMTVAQLIDKYVERMRKDRKDFRTLDYVANALDRLVKPQIGKRAIYDLKRRDIADMLDKIADGSGPVMADRTLGYLRAVFNWRAAVDDDLVPPFAKGMAKTRPLDHVRTRILADAEIMAVWKATGADEHFSRFIRFLLLSGCRRGEAAAMPWTELDITKGLWTLPAGRNKAKFELARPLSKTAMAQLIPNGEKYVFGFSNAGMTRGHKALLEASGTRDWIIHDLRRTARTLLARAGIQSEIAERCLGHKQSRIEETYNKHSYEPEMARAYESLAQLIEQIVNPRPNILSLRGH